MKKIIALISIFLLSTVLLYPVDAKSKNTSTNGIVLDGYFDDWVDKPYDQFKYSWNNKGQYATVKWYTDDENLYLYIKMGDVGYSTLSNNTIVYHVAGGNKSQFQLSVDNPSKGRASVYEYSIDYHPLSSDGYVVRGNANSGVIGDQAEFRIPLSVFSKKNGKISEVKLEFPDLGDQFIIFHAGSTAPYLGIGICIAASALGFLYYKKRKRKA